MRRFLRLGHTPNMLTCKVRPVAESPATTITEADVTSTEGQFSHPLPALDTKSSSKLAFVCSEGESVRSKKSDSLRKGFGSGFSASTLDGEEREIITWPMVAEAVDRLLFLSFSLFVFLVTIIMLPCMAAMAE